MEILLSWTQVSTTEWCHHLDFNKVFKEKAKWKLHNDAASCSEQILEVAPHKTATILPFLSHLTNHPSKTNKTFWALLEKQGWSHKYHSPTNGHTNVGWSAKTYIHPLHSDTRCCAQDMARTMADGNGWQERIKGIHVIGITWWWYNHIHMLHQHSVCMFRDTSKRRINDEMA